MTDINKHILPLSQAVEISLRIREARALREVAEATPIGEDTRPKDRVKQGISPHTEIIDIDCT
jgi:hypothetical protein